MIRRVQQFGGDHTDQKQDVVLRYLNAYATALKDRFEIFYIDAFAGSGWRIEASAAATTEAGLFDMLPDAVSKPRPGTALQVLTQHPFFHRYVFGDKSEKNVQSLKDAVQREREQARKFGNELPDPEIFCGDASDLIQRECARMARNRNSRAVIFLDPFGMQVNWTTLERISKSSSDLWLLVPTEIAINRMLPNRGTVPEKWARGLTRFFGEEHWRDAFLSEQTGFFGEFPSRKKSKSLIIDYAMTRFRTLFGEGLFSQPLELRIRSRPAYHLVFACCNPSAKAREASFRIAGHILRRAKN